MSAQPSRGIGCQSLGKIAPNESSWKVEPDLNRDLPAKVT